METKVKCNVDECAHNLGGERCSAQAVEINYNNSTADQETICNTYRPQYEGADNLVYSANINYSGLENRHDSANVNPVAMCQVQKCRHNSKDGYCHADSIDISLSETSECTTYDPE